MSVRGSWRAQFGVTIDRTRRPGVATGTMRMRPPGGRGGTLCLRLSTTQVLRRDGKLAITGRFTVVGGTGRAARLHGSGRYRGPAGAPMQAALNVRRGRPRVVRRCLR